MRSDALQVKEHIKAVLSGASTLSRFLFQATELIFFYRADIILLSVDRSSLVTFFEGSTIAAVGPRQEGMLIGQDLRTVWPDPRLHEAVSKILDENLVRPFSLRDERARELMRSAGIAYAVDGDPFGRTGGQAFISVPSKLGVRT